LDEPARFTTGTPCHGATGGLGTSYPTAAFESADGASRESLTDRDMRYRFEGVDARICGGCSRFGTSAAEIGFRSMFGLRGEGYPLVMALLLWILAVVLVVAGVLALFRRQILWGVVLIVVGLLVGPGGVSIFT
jgi:hypothetical protein